MIGLALLAPAYLWGVAFAYNRDDNPHWVDLDGDGQDTRQEILVRDSRVSVTFDERGWVKTGLRVRPYTGRVVTDPGDIDHLLALGEVDVAGASAWSLGERTAFLNDPNNLVAVYNVSNRSKGDQDAYLWLPPNIANCAPGISKRVRQCGTSTPSSSMPPSASPSPSSRTSVRCMRRESSSIGCDAGWGPGSMGCSEGQQLPALSCAPRPWGITWVPRRRQALGAKFEGAVEFLFPVAPAPGRARSFVG